MPEYLFIGGSRDGERIHLSEERDFIKVSVPDTKIVAKYEGENVVGNNLVFVEYYERKLMYSDDRTCFALYVHASKSYTDMLKALINGYRPEKREGK